MQRALYKREDEFAPSYFFVQKQLIASFKDCEQALQDPLVNHSLEQLYHDWQKGLSFKAEKLEFIESLVLEPLNAYFSGGK